jgi:hypothetical protein
MKDVLSSLKGTLDKKAPNLMVVGTVAVAMYALYSKMSSNLKTQQGGTLSGEDKLRLGAGTIVAGGVVLGAAFSDWMGGGGSSRGLGVIKKCPSKFIDPDRPMSDQKWCLLDRKGKKLLGRHSSRESALRQERGIHLWKKRGK